MHADPRRAASRARILGAATSLLGAGGPAAVTVAAVTQDSGVARATMYRHFSSVDDLLAAAFDSMLPAPVIPAASGLVRDRLAATVLTQAEVLIDDPTAIAAMSWLAGTQNDKSEPNVGKLRAHLINLFAGPLHTVLCTREAKIEFGEVDAGEAAAHLLGPIALGAFLGLPPTNRAKDIPRAVAAFLTPNFES